MSSFGIIEVITLLMGLSGLGVQNNPKARTADVALEYAVADADVIAHFDAASVIPEHGKKAASNTPDLVALPRARRNLLAMLLGGRTPAFGRQLAGRSHARIPDVSIGVSRSLDRYDASPLARFHRDFDATAGMAVPTPDREDMPPCVSPALDTPNDLLLKPEHIQHLTRWLVSRGWTARQVAELVCSTYQQDHQWGGRGRRADARTRAEFDVRVFGGLIATGLDTMIDFNCVSAQEKDLCPRVGCPHDLRVDRDRALAMGRR